MNDHDLSMPDFRDHPETFSTYGLDAQLSELVRKHSLAVKDMDEQQLVEVIRQQILSGDIMKHVYFGHNNSGYGHKQSMVYAPYSGIERLKAENAELKRKLKLVEEAVK